MAGTSPAMTNERASAEKFADRLDDLLLLFEVRQVAGPLDQRDLRAGNALRKLLRIDRRDDAVGVAPDDQGRRRDAMDAPAQAAIGDRPDELAGAGLGPDELGQRLDARRR